MKITISIMSFLIISILFSCEKNTGIPNDVEGENPVEDTSASQYGEPFEKVPLTEDIIMYEVNLRAFSSSGDLKGVIERLDDLKSLGINTIWLMPLHPIGEVNSVNSPYSVKDYLQISKEYGSLSDLRALTDAAHHRDMAVIMDWIANHTSWDNPWISNKDWYTQDESGNIVHPPGTNWLDVADLDFNNIQMRQSMIEAMKYWILEANVDGYRCDYADGVPYDFWLQALDTLTSIPNRKLILLAEGSRRNHYNAGFQMTYAWDFYNSTKSIYIGESASKLYLTHMGEYNAMPMGKHKLRYTTNHDESAWDDTPMSLFNGKKGATTASVLSIFMGGVPLIYTGQEVGRLDKVPFFSNDPINWEENPDMLDEYKILLNHYSQSKIAKKGSITDYSNADVVCFKKSIDGKEMLVVANTADKQLNFILPPDLRNTIWVDKLNGEEVSLGIVMTLTNYEYLILEH